MAPAGIKHGTTPSDCNNATPVPMDAPHNVAQLDESQSSSQQGQVMSVSDMSCIAAISHGASTAHVSDNGCRAKMRAMRM
jgi:hypothetical protein